MSEADASGAREDELPAFRSAAHALVDGVADHLAALPSGPVWQPLPDALREQLLGLPLPEHPAALDDLVATALRDVLPHAMGNGHPAFFGWVNPPPSPAGVMASLAAAAMNPSVVSGDHADVHLERAVVRWLAELVGFPHAPGAGLLTSGGSAATIVCIAGARSRALAASGHDVRRDGLAGAPQLVAYVPAEAHSCVRRALELLGLGSSAMREVPLEGGRLDATALRASIAADRASGALPALLVGSAGTVNAGAIDPLDALADVATAEDLWFHVDGAYGAFGVLDPAIADRYRGMEQADSLVLDPHKWLGVPVDAGCALVQRGDDLRDAFSLIPPYLRHYSDAPVGSFAEYGLEQTRPFRALKTWATIAARGRAGLAAQVARANALARELATLVEREPELELAAAPETSIVAFRARPTGCPPTRLDELNRALPEAVQARGRAFVTGTVFGGRETLRACILHPDTSSDHLATLVAEVVATARTLVAASDGGSEIPSPSATLSLMMRDTIQKKLHSSVVPPDDEIDHVRGPAAGRLILEYGDYECPYSRQAFREIERIEQRLSGGIRFAFRHFPLTEIHPHALAAAAAAEAAALQGRFWDMHELLFHRQRALEEDDLRRYAAELGLDVSRFNRDRSSPDVLRRIGRDVEGGLASGEVRGTPTLFIDGVVHLGGYDAATLMEALAR